LDGWREKRPPAADFRRGRLGPGLLAASTIEPFTERLALDG
jgi:hypothetical protein